MVSLTRSPGCAALLGLVLAAGCGADPSDQGLDGACPCDAPRPDGGAGGPFDLATASFRIANASNTPGTISHDGALAFAGDGTTWIAFAEPLATDSGDQDIDVTWRRGGGDFTPSAPVTSDTAVQNAFPAMVSDGDVLHLVWSGYPEGANDIYYARREGASFSARTNLTLASESSPRDDVKPALAIGPGGDLAVAYASTEAVEGADTEIRVVRISGGAVTGPPVTVIAPPAAGQSCYDPAAAFDAAGHLHVVADCGPVFDEDVVYATDATGGWQSRPLPAPGRDDTNPSIAVMGGDVHVVWKADDGHLLYAVSRAGAAFAAPVPVNGSEPGFAPRLALDLAGRPLVMFQRANAANFFDIWLTLSEDGLAFAEARNVTSGTDDSDEWFPYQIAVHPQTGLPSLSFTKIMAGTDPLDTEIMIAEAIGADEG